MFNQIFKKILFIIIFLAPLLNACGGKLGDARKSSPDPRDRVQKNIEEGRGFRLSTLGQSGGTNYEFASSNPLWRASLDIIDFMPLATANYSGGVIVTDWYSKDATSNEAIKISIRFLTNDIRSDALGVKVFYKKCKISNSCYVEEDKGELKNELVAQILKTATQYKENDVQKEIKPYIMAPEKR